MGDAIMVREAKTDARMAADLDILRGMLAREMKTSWARVPQSEALAHRKDKRRALDSSRSLSAKFRLRRNFGAVERTRTSTVLLPPAPQAGASASSATTARGLQMHFSLQSFSLQSWMLASSAEFTVDGPHFKAGESCPPKGSATRERYGFFGCDGTGCEVGGACCEGGCAVGF